MYSVKVTYKGEVRRLQLSVDKSSETYLKLTDTIRSIFPGLTQPFTLTWKDDEDDIVTVSSELELQEAIRVMAYQQGLLKFTVNDAPARPSGRQAADPQGNAHCFRNNRGSCFAPFGLPHPQGPHPYHNFGRRHPCGRGFGGPREALFHLFGRHPAAAPFCPGLGPRFPLAPAFVPPPAAAAAAHEAALFGLPLEAVADFAEALALELSEAIQKGEEERAATSKADAATAAAPATGSVVHVGVTCDVCGVSPITGPRYKCTVRDNYDVCAACYESQLQPYPMLKIVTNGGVGTVVTPGAPVVRDLNDEDAGLQAAISESYASATTTASVPAADVPPALLSHSTISVTSATVDDNEGEGGVEDVYSEADYSLVHNTAASAATAEKFSLAADRQAALAAATAAPAVAPPSAAEVWAKELQLLSDMGFTDKQELIPLLQQHIGTPASASVGGATSVEGLQKVVSTLLFR